MDLHKRKSSFDQLSKERTKKLRDEYDQSIIYIENLSNEIFYEIFDYLNGCEIYESFSNLNSRFQQLVNSSSFLFKIKLDRSTSRKIFIKNYQEMIPYNRYKIFSIHLSTFMYEYEIISSFNIDSSVIHLESLVLDAIEPNLLQLLLPKLIDLPRLFSLTLDTDDALNDLSTIYQLIFHLSKLKYLKFSAFPCLGFKITASLPMVDKIQISPIENLVINHPCIFNELSTIVSYTSQLRRLCLFHIEDNDSITGMTLLNLTHLTIYADNPKFVELQVLIKNMHCILKFLRIVTRSEDINFLDATQWEQFILQDLSQLEKFYLQYYKYIDYGDDNELPTYTKESTNQFISSFWIQRQWIFDIEIEDEHIVYSIHPYKKRWYEYAQDKIIDFSLQLSKSTQLTFIYISPDDFFELLMLDIGSVISVTQIYHLEICRKPIFINTLIQILDLLPELISLKIYSLSLLQQQSLVTEEILITNSNKIENVCLEKIININEIDFLLKFCSRMNYLQINDINNIDVELFVEDILLKILNHNCNLRLRLLCFCLPIADDKIVEKLEEMINLKKLIVDYSIERVHESIYIQL